MADHCLDWGTDKSLSFPQELLSLLEHLDKRKRGHVTLDEFVKGLQAVRNAAAVVTSTPSIHRIIRRRHSDQVHTQQ